jgi:hypothetical protein
VHVVLDSCGNYVAHAVLLSWQQLPWFMVLQEYTWYMLLSIIEELPWCTVLYYRYDDVVNAVLSYWQKLTRCSVAYFLHFDVVHTVVYY